MRIKIPLFFSSIFKASPDGKFGTIKGVLIPNILQMIGVILFMRLGWVLGHVGMMEMGIIITLSALLLLATGLSLTAIVSNMKIRAGGAYYLISRNLGIQFGSAIGILILVSQLCSIALCVTGFSLSFYEIFPHIPLPVLKAGTLISLVLISYFSTDLALKTQIFIFTSLATAIAGILLGSGSPPETLVPTQDANSSITFWMGFAMFFPAMTGIESGMSMSGDLQNPSRSLPIGTLGAIGIVYCIYMIIALFLSSHASSELLKSYPFIIYHISKIGYLVVMGIWAATLSSALGAILGGPRIMQAVAKDGILPRFLAKGYGPANQPRIATLTIFIPAMILTVATDINQIIPILTMSCLISYGLINFIAFIQIFIRNPSWRPAIRVPSIIPLIGGLGCFMTMFMINPGATFIEIALVAFLFFLGAKRKIMGNWDDLRQGIFAYLVHKGTIKLSTLKNSARSWRPHILTIFDTPLVNKNLAFFSHAINQERGFLTFGASMISEETDKSFQNLKTDLKGFKIPSYIHGNRAAHPVEGAKQIIENYGFGFLKPNTVILPIAKTFDNHSFTQLLLDTHRQEKNLVLLKDDAQRDYLFTDPSRKNKQINLWWRGKYPGNFEFSLALAYLMQQSRLWPRSKIFIKTITTNEERKTKMLEQFGKYRTKLRIQDLFFTPLVDPEAQFFPNLLAHSKDADLTFLGLKKPKQNTSLEEYNEYLAKLLESTSDLNNIAFVMCGEKVRFRKIFI